jgi:hypothetical protein
VANASLTGGDRAGVEDAPGEGGVCVGFGEDVAFKERERHQAQLVIEYRAPGEAAAMGCGVPQPGQRFQNHFEWRQGKARRTGNPYESAINENPRR